MIGSEVMSRRQLVDEVRAIWKVSIRRTCAVLRAERSSYHYQEPASRPIFEALVAARQVVPGRIRALDAEVCATVRRSRVARLFMAVPGVGPITALAVASAFDDATRFRSSTSAGACLGLTPRRYESGEISRDGCISRHGDRMTRTHLHEAANAS